MDADFDEWWELWPKKVAKGAAVRAYRSARKLASAEELLEALRPLGWRWQQLPPERRPYVVHPATYLNQQRWLDQPEEVIRLEAPDSRGGVDASGRSKLSATRMSHESEEQWDELERTNPEMFSSPTPESVHDSDRPAF